MCDSNAQPNYFLARRVVFTNEQKRITVTSRFFESWKYGTYYFQLVEYVLSMLSNKGGMFDAFFREISAKSLLASEKEFT